MTTTAAPGKKPGHGRRGPRRGGPAGPPPPPPQGRIGLEIDSRIDERFDSETTRSSVAIVIAGFAALIALMAAVAMVLVARGGSGHEGTAAAAVATTGAAGAATHTMPDGSTMAMGAQPSATASTAGAAENVAFEPYRRPDPNLPAPPPGPVKNFRVEVYQHVTKVAAGLPPTEVWSFGVNGKLYRGTGVSAPLVVTEGDRVKLTLVNGSSRAMNVTMGHSIDLHAAEVAPNVAFATIPPGAEHTIKFVAEHPGVFMYHCATAPILLHAGAGMVGMMVVKPKDLPPVSRELWLTQQEFFIGEPGGIADLAKIEAGQPDVVAFNGYANQYSEHPITVPRGKRIRIYVMNADVSHWSAFHVIGSVFDRTVVEGMVGHDSQTISLAPSQGGWVELSLAQEGNYMFVTHDFADMVKGAMGVLRTEHAPPVAPGGGH